MPLYSYECSRCGPFRQWQSMSRSDRAARCPRCSKASPRGVAAPRLAMPGAQSRAHAINETSAHEPKVVRRKTGRHGHDHGHGGHAHQHNHRGKRPWMIGH